MKTPSTCVDRARVRVVRTHLLLDHAPLWSAMDRVAWARAYAALTQVKHVCLGHTRTLCRALLQATHACRPGVPMGHELLVLGAHFVAFLVWASPVGRIRGTFSNIRGFEEPSYGST